MALNHRHRIFADDIRARLLHPWPERVLDALYVTFLDK